MRVLHCTDGYLPQVNGVSVVTSVIVHGLRQRGWDCHLVTPRYPSRNGEAHADRRVSGEHEGARTELPSVPLPVYPENRLAFPNQAAVDRVVRSCRPDLVHCDTEFVIGRLGQVAAKRARIPVVTSYHTDWAKYARSYGVPFLAGVVSRHLARFHRRAARTYTPSIPARDALHAMGVRDVEVWGRGVDTTRFHPRHRSAALRAQLGLGDAFTFLYVGRLAPEKNVEVVLRAFAALASTPTAGRPVRMLVAGVGPSERALRSAAPPGTEFLGELERRHALPALYASADAFVFASTTETLGLVVLEAMASGLPVVATPAGGVADHLRDGVNGLTFATGDVGGCRAAIARLAAGPRLHAELAIGARETAETLGWDRELDRLDASYREVCGATSARAAEEVRLLAG